MIGDYRGVFRGPNLCFSRVHFGTLVNRGYCLLKSVAADIIDKNHKGQQKLDDMTSPAEVM